MTRFAPALCALLFVALGALSAPPAAADELDVPLDLARVEGADKLPGGARERERLARNGFVVLPRFHKQIFSTYIGGSLPYYVTTDSAHHTYHVLFETALKEVERGVAARLREFVIRLHERIEASPPPEAGLPAEGRSLALAHVAVAGRLLGADALVPAPLQAKVASEVQRIEAAAGRAPSPLFGVNEEYALYRPRGFYEGDATLERYFRAATWLGRRGFRVSDERETWAALHLVRTIQSDDALRTALVKIASFLDWMLGPPDDLTVAQYAAALATTVGPEISEGEIAERFAEIRGALAQLPSPEINAQVLSPEAWRRFGEETKGLRLLPSRRTPDAWLFQTLAEEDRDRALPSGLEVALALGSERAAAHLVARDEAGRRAAGIVGSKRAGFVERMAGTHYGDTLRTASLLFDATQPLLGGGSAPTGEKGTPIFPAPLFATGGWHDRLLATGLSGWTSLRHAWVLHAKTSMYALGATRDPAGIVEPVPPFFGALASLARTLVRRAEAVGAFREDRRAVLRRFLAALEMAIRMQADPPTSFAEMQRLADELHVLEEKGGAFERLCQAREVGWEPELVNQHVLPPLRAWLAGQGDLDEAERKFVDELADSATRQKLLELAELLDEVERIAEKGLRGTALSESDGELIKDYGKTIAALNFFGGNSWLSPQKQMGLVVDVASDPNRGLHQHAAVGAAMEMYVALPLRGGGHRLYQGGVYAWYEFPETEPLTDAEWIQRVEGRHTPPLPSWTRSYVVSADVEDVARRVRAGETVDGLENLHDLEIARALLDRLQPGRHEPPRLDGQLSWAVSALAPYGESELRPRILDILIHWVLFAREGLKLGIEASMALAEIVGPEDAARLFAILRDPPADAEDKARRRLAQALAGTGAPDLLQTAGPLLAHPESEVRRAMLELASRMRERDGITKTQHADWIVRFLARTEDDADRFPALLNLIPVLDGLRPEHAKVLVKLLDSQDRRVAQRAISAWGHAVGKMPEDDAYVARATMWLAERFRAGPWEPSRGCIDGLGAIRTPAAMAELAKIASEWTRDNRLRRGAIEALRQHEERALPHLFGLAFDETVTADRINGQALYVCHWAAEAIDEILGRRFEWERLSSTEDGRREAMRAIRAEAERRGVRR